MELSKILPKKKDITQETLALVKSREFKIFLAFLLIFTVFIHWGADNAWSRYDLTKAMVEDQSVEITEYAYNTQDKSTPIKNLERYMAENRSQHPSNHTGELPLSSLLIVEKKKNLAKVNKKMFQEVFERPYATIYSDKAPMSSILAIPPYVIGDAIGGYLSEGKDTWVDEGIRKEPVNLSMETALKQFLIVLTVSAAFGSALLVLIYRGLQNYVEEKIALYTLTIAGTATPIITYSTSFFGVINAAFFGFASYVALHKSREKRSTKLMCAAGIFSALAISTELYAGIIPATLVLYLVLHREKENILRFALGGFIGIVPLLIYNWLVTGNPLAPSVFAPSLITPSPIEASACSIYPSCSTSNQFFVGFSWNPIRVLNAAFRLLFFETRGLFFFSPILLLSIPGVYEIYKKDKKLLVLFPGTFLLFLVFQASYINWLSGLWFGPRYMVVGLPFLLLPTALGLKRMMSKGKAFKVFILLVFLFSSFNMFLGMNNIAETDVNRDTYNERFHSLSAIQPNLYEHLLEQFEKYGSRSELMMSLTDRYRGFDITRRSPYGPESLEVGSIGNTGIFFSTKYIPLMLVSATLLGLVWKRSIVLTSVGAISVVLLLLLSFSLSSTHVLGETYRGTDYIRGSNGSTNTVFHSEKGEMPYLEARAITSQGQTTEVNVSVSGKHWRTYNMSGKEKLYFPSKIDRGRKEIYLESPNCLEPVLYENSSEKRCLTVSVRNLSHINSEEIEKPLLVSGWHELGKFSEENESAWMREEAALAVKSEGGPRMLELDLESTSHLKDTKLEVAVNGRKKNVVSPSRGRSVYVPIEAEEGWNQIKLETERCVVPARNSDSEDDRCLSFELNNVTLHTAQDFPEKVFGNGWYSEEENEEGETWRWMKNESNLFFFSKGLETLNISAEPYPEISDSKLRVFINGRRITNFSFNDLTSKSALLKPEAGAARIRLESSKGCRVPMKHNSESEDSRCLGFRVDNVSLKQSNLPEIEYKEGWYKQEEGRKGTFRWMGEKGNISFLAREGEAEIVLEVQRYGNLIGSNLEIFVNGESAGEIEPESSTSVTRRFEVETEEGVNSLKLLSETGCVVPAEVEKGSQDQRCLSFQVEDFQVKGLE